MWPDCVICMRKSVLVTKLRRSPVFLWSDREICQARGARLGGVFFGLHWDWAIDLNSVFSFEKLLGIRVP